MLTTEAEAKTRRCLLSRAAGAPCVASECMAWRWASPATFALKIYRVGFCGHAGEPETHAGPDGKQVTAYGEHHESVATS